MNKKIFAQEVEEDQLAESLNQVTRLVEEIESLNNKAITLVNSVVNSLRSLISNSEYFTPEHAQKIDLFIKRMGNLEESLKGELENPLSGYAPLEMPLPPEEENIQASSIFNQFSSEYTMLRQQLSVLIPKIRTARDLIERYQSTGFDWASKDFFETKKNNFDLVIKISHSLGLTDIVAQIKRKAYPVMNFKEPLNQVDLKVWNNLAAQITAFKRAYPDYTFSQILYHFTKDWDMFDRFEFKKWYKWTHKLAKDNKMKKTIFADYVQQDRLQKFEKKKRVLLNRINLVRKALMDLANSNLISKDASNKIYKVLSMLEFEAMGIQSTSITAARIRRSAKQLKKLGFIEGFHILKSASEDLLNKNDFIVKKADSNVDIKRISALLRTIKDEMDKLSYAKHLESLFNLKKELEDMGRTADAEAVLKIIRDDLDVLDKLNKKLTDVYVNLSRIPIQLTEQEDLVLKKDTDQSPEIEIVEEEKPKAQMTPKEVSKPQPSGLTRRTQPDIATEIPNV